MLEARGIDLALRHQGRGDNGRNVETQPAPYGCSPACWCTPATPWPRCFERKRFATVCASADSPHTRHDGWSGHRSPLARRLQRRAVPRLPRDQDDAVAGAFVRRILSTTFSWRANPLRAWNALRASQPLYGTYLKRGPANWPASGPTLSCCCSSSPSTVLNSNMPPSASLTLAGSPLKPRCSAARIFV